MPGTPLPPSTPNPYKHLQGALEQAYRLCLNLESWNPSSLPDAEHFTLPSTEVAGRLLGYLLLFLPPPADEELARQIVQSPDEGARLDLATEYFRELILLFRRDPPTPNAFECFLQPLPLPEEDDELFEEGLKEGPESHRALKALALKRDGYRCLVTGYVDSPSIRAGKVLEDGLSASGIMHVGRIVPERLATIITPSLFSDADTAAANGKTEDLQGRQPEPEKDLSSVANILARFPDPKLPVQLTRSDLNTLKNVLTLRSDVHALFANLCLWFEETDIPHQYKIGRIMPSLLRGLVEPITFPTTSTTPNPQYDPPDPAYLRLHALCARVAHLSGAGELVERMLGDFGDLDSILGDVVGGERELAYLDLRLCGLGGG